MDAGADDVGTDGDLIKVTSDPSDLVAVREALEAEGVEVQSSELAMDPKTVVEITDEAEARRLVGLMETLDDHDDVDAVHANFDIPAELSGAGRGVGRESLKLVPVAPIDPARAWALPGKASDPAPRIQT